jgi:hypothetical protein
MLEAVLSNNDNGEFPQVVVEQINLGGDGEEDVVFQFELDDLALGGHMSEDPEHAGTQRTLLETLRAAGIDVKEERTEDKKERKEKEGKKADGDDQLSGRDEL